VSICLALACYMFRVLTFHWQVSWCGGKGHSITCIREMVILTDIPFNPLCKHMTHVRHCLGEWILLWSTSFSISSNRLPYLCYSDLYKKTILWCSFSTQSRALFNCSLSGLVMPSATLLPSRQPCITWLFDQVQITPYIGQCTDP